METLQRLVINKIEEDISHALMTNDYDVLHIYPNGDEFIAVYNEGTGDRPEVSVNFILADKDNTKTRITNLSYFDPSWVRIYIEDVSI